MKNKKVDIEEYITEMLLICSLTIMVVFMLNFQLVVLGFDNSLFIYLLLCLGGVGLAIMINKGLLEDDKN